jgi:hypothetical protein
MTMQDEKKKPSPNVSVSTTMMRRLFRAQAEAQGRAAGECWSRVAGMAVFVVGTIVMVGWLLELRALRHLFDWLVTMKANTALSFLLSGIALWLLRGEPVPGARSVFQDRRRLLGASYACVVVLVGVLTLAEYVFGFQLGIDHLVFLPAVPQAGRFKTGPMEIEIATNFILIGVALWLMNVRRYRRAIQMLIALVIVICVSSAVGVFSGITLPPGARPVAPMTTLTVVTFFLLCIGLLLAGRQFTERDRRTP